MQNQIKINCKITTKFTNYSKKDLEFEQMTFYLSKYYFQPMLLCLLQNIPIGDYASGIFFIAVIFIIIKVTGLSNSAKKGD